MQYFSVLQISSASLSITDLRRGLVLMVCVAAGERHVEAGSLIARRQEVWGYPYYRAYGTTDVQLWCYTHPGYDAIYKLHLYYGSGRRA
eukprot:1801323-Rhodomonas_salina.3